MKTAKKLLLSKKGNIMTHKEYTTPLTNINILAIENLMITASPGVGGPYQSLQLSTTTKMRETIMTTHIALIGANSGALNNKTHRSL